MQNQNTSFFKKILNYINSVIDYLKHYEPVTEMTRSDLEEILKELNKNKNKSSLITRSELLEILEKIKVEESGSAGTSESYLNEISEEIKKKDSEKEENKDINEKIINRKNFRTEKIIAYLIVISISIWGFIGPGVELIKEYEENKKTKEVVKSLNEVAKTMYYRENAPKIALKTIEKSLALDNQNADTIYLKIFIESMLTVELIKNLDRPYNEEELLNAQTALANAEFMLKSPSNNYLAEAHLIKAQTYFALKDNEQALIEINKAIKYDLKELFYKIRKASILVESKKYDKALELLKKLEKVYLDKKEKKYIYLWQGLTYFELLKLSTSSEDDIKYHNLMKRSYEKAIELDNKFHLALMNLATTYAQSYDGIKENNIEHRKKAIKLYKDVLRIRPGNKEIFYLLGRTYGMIDKYEKSILYFKKALLQDKDYFSANLWLGKVYFELGNNELALKYYDKALLINPSSVNTYFRRAKSYQKLGNYKEAIKDYLEIIEEFDNNYYKHRAYINRALISINNNDFSNAKDFLNKSKEFKSAISDNFYKVEFKYHSELGLFEKAITSINHAIKISNKQKNSLKYMKALYLFNQNKSVDALNTINTIKISSIEKSGLTLKVLKLKYKIYTKKKDEKNMQRVIIEIKKYDPNFK